MNAWSVLLATPLFAYLPPSISYFAFYTPILLVPFAALLGRRYGVSGVVSVALGGILLVPAVGGPWGGVGGNPALYLVALAAAAIAALPRPLAECLRWPESDRAAGWVSFIAPIFLVLGIGTASADLGGGLHMRFAFWPSWLGYFLLFVLGARGARLPMLLLGLVATAALGWTLALQGVSMYTRTALFVSLYPLQPVTVLAALAVYFAGETTGAFLAGRPVGGFWQRPYWAVIALVVLWFGPSPISSIPVSLGTVRSVSFLHAAAVLPVAAFVVGLLRGARGTIFITAVVTGLPIVWLLGSWILWESGVTHNYSQMIPLEAPFVAATYGVMGARAAEFRSGKASFQKLRLPTLLVLVFLAVLGATLKILGEGGPMRTALAALFVFAAIVAGILVLWVVRAMAARGVSLTSEKWAPFVAILGVVGTAATNLQAVGVQLKQLLVLVLLPLSLFSAPAREEVRAALGGAIDGEMLAYLLASAALYLGVFIATVRGAWRVTPKICEDIRKILTFVRDWRQGRIA
jgi:hypothetical protein